MHERCEVRSDGRGVGAGRLRRRYDLVWRRSYENPSPGFAAIAGFLAFYPSRVDHCRVGDEEVVAQPGDFYGGWITSEINGPFKGPPGTRGW